MTDIQAVGFCRELRSRSETRNQKSGGERRKEKERKENLFRFCRSSGIKTRGSRKVTLKSS